jgi:hypothetical protein
MKDVSIDEAVMQAKQFWQKRND